MSVRRCARDWGISAGPLSPTWDLTFSRGGDPLFQVALDAATPLNFHADVCRVYSGYIVYKSWRQKVH